MSIVCQDNGLLAEVAVFPVTPTDQQHLLQQVIQTLESTLKPSPGFVSGSVFRSRDGERVTSYVQWANQEPYVTIPAISGFASPDAHLYEIFATTPQASEIYIATDMEGLINFGIFKLKQPENQPRFMELFRQALQMVSGQHGLISTHAHRSLDGWRCINFGYWRSLEDYTAMDRDRPFSSLFGEMLDLADNEYQKTLHEVFYVT
jgi:heme-degrading monooxygenase HmoA